MLYLALQTWQARCWLCQRSTVRRKLSTNSRTTKLKQVPEQDPAAFCVALLPQLSDDLLPAQSLSSRAADSQYMA
jgi:hypothetical protein